MRSRAFVAVAGTAVLLMAAGQVTTLLQAQSSAASSATPKLTGYGDGGLIGRPRPGGGGGRVGSRGGGGGESEEMRALVVTAGLMMLTVGVFAHHSQAPLYDLSKTAEIQGVVKQWEFKNPHPILHVDVRDQAGKTNEWLLMFHNVSVMKRLGVTKDTFTPGMTIKAHGPPSRVPGTYGMSADLVVLPGGREIRPGAGGGTLEIPN